MTHGWNLLVMMVSKFGSSVFEGQKFPLIFWGVLMILLMDEILHQFLYR